MHAALCYLSGVISMLVDSVTRAVGVLWEGCKLGVLLLHVGLGMMTKRGGVGTRNLASLSQDEVEECSYGGVVQGIEEISMYTYKLLLNNCPPKEHKRKISDRILLTILPAHPSLV